MTVGTFLFSETSPAAAGTAASSQPVANAASYAPGGVAVPIDDYDAIDVAAEFGGATGGTLDVYVQVSPDQGVTWYDVIHFLQAAAASGTKYYQAPLSLATNTSTPTQVGKNLTPALAAGSSGVVNGAFTDRMRLVMVAGSGTSAGTSVIVRISGQRARADEYGR